MAMMHDAGPPLEDQPGADRPAGAQGPGRAARPLGRGLEEISYLFLSQSAATPPGEPTGDRTLERDEVRPSIRAGVAVLRRGAPLTKDQVVTTLTECRSALADDLLVIAAGIPCSPYGEIDLLALDHAHQLTIIDVDTTPGDGLLVRGLSHVDWVVNNFRMVQRLYPAWGINTSRQPRLALVAPRFSAALTSTIRQVAQPAISCFRYRELELSGGTGLFIERLDGE